MNESASKQAMGLPIAMLICGTCLVIMPQIHESVVPANALYAAAIHPCLSGPFDDTIENITTCSGTWMGSASVTLGSAGVLVGVLLGCLPHVHRLRA